MWVHFHNETKIREYNTEDWDELITLIENDIGMDKGVEKITFKASKTAEECEVNPDLFDEIMAVPNNSAHGVFNVYFAVKRMVKLPNEHEPREIFCIDFEHFVQQVEEMAGSTVQRITYTAKGPTGKAIEFEVGEDTFTELPNLVFKAYFEGDDDEEGPSKSTDSVYTLEMPGIPHPFIIRGDLYWSDLVNYIHHLYPKRILNKVVAKDAKGKETEVTESTFNGIDTDTVTFSIDLVDKPEFEVTITSAGKKEPQKFNVVQYADLLDQIEQVEEKPVHCLMYQKTDANGTVVEEAVDEDNFDELVANHVLTFKAQFAPGTLQKHQKVFVQMPGDNYPMFLSVTDLTDLTSKIDAFLSPEGGEVSGVMYKKDGKEEELDGDTFATIQFPNDPLIIMANEPNIRRIQFEWDDKPVRVFCKDLDQMMEAIHDLLPEGKEIAELTYVIKGPHGQKLVQTVDEMAFLDAAEDPTMIFNVKATGFTPVLVRLPDDDLLKLYKTTSYADLVKQIESDTTLLVSRLTNAVERNGQLIEMAVTEDTFEQQVTSNSQIHVYFKEVPTMKVLMPGSDEPVSISVSDYGDMMAQIQKLAGNCDVEKLTYAVQGPKGQAVEVEITEADWEEVAEDPENAIVKVHLGPPPRQYSLQFPEGSVTVSAKDYESLQKEIRKQAGGRRVSTVLVQNEANAAELTPDVYTKLDNAKESALKVVLAPIAEGSWVTVTVKFPFEKNPRKISGCEYEGVIQELSKQAPEGFLELEKLTYYTDGIELDVDEGNFKEVLDSNIIFYAHFNPDPKYQLPSRHVFIEGTEQKFPVYAATFKDFMEVIEEIAAGRPIVHLIPDVEGADADDDVAKAFYDLPRDTTFRLGLAKGSQAAGARVRFPHTLEEILLEAHTFDRLMHLIKQEARGEGYKVAKVTYFVEGPAGQKMECEDLDEDVFESLEDLDQCVFKVYYEGQPKGSKLVLYPDDDEPHQVLAETYEEFIEAIMEENPDRPGVDMILYEVPAPKGGKVSFPLTEDAWDELAEETNVVFKVFFPLPTTELMVQFPWDESPKSVAAGTFEELQASIAKACPADQKVTKLTYSVPGPSGFKLEFPLDEAAFDDIDDADTVVKVHTTPAKALYVQYPAAPITWQSDFKAFMKEVQASATPGKRVKSVFVTLEGQEECRLDADRYKLLANAEGFALRVEYE